MEATAYPFKSMNHKDSIGVIFYCAFHYLTISVNQCLVPPFPRTRCKNLGQIISPFEPSVSHCHTGVDCYYLFYQLYCIFDKTLLMKFVYDATVKNLIQVYNPLAITLKLKIFFLKTGSYFITPLTAKHGITWFEAIDNFYLSYLVQTFIPELWMSLIIEYCSDSNDII